MTECRLPFPRNPLSSELVEEEVSKLRGVTMLGLAEDRLRSLEVIGEGVAKAGEDNTGFRLLL